MKKPKKPKVPKLSGLKMGIRQSRRRKRGNLNMKALSKALLAIAVVLLLPWRAHAICTTVTATTATTKILKANDMGSVGRKLLMIQNLGASNPVYCDVGGGTNGTTATVNAGIFIPVGDPPLQIPPFQQSTKSFPIAPNGEVDCITATGSSPVSVCDW